MSKSAKVALITGAARRIGAEIAHTLHKAGFNVVLHYNRSEEEANRLCALFNEKRQDSALTLYGNLTDTKQLHDLVKQAAHQWNRLDVLINNASLFYKTAVNNVTEEAWDDLLNCNLKAPFFLCQAAMSYLQKWQGCIVNIADVHAERPLRDYGVYCISKAGLLMLTQVLAKELGPDIRVNTVSPGTVMWPDGENQLSDELKEKIMNRTALQRHGAPQDIAKAVLYLVTEATYVTGTILTVDGGRSLMI